MVKVLSGQSLYMAKHIISQITHEDIHAEPFESPVILGVPCISTKLYNSTPVDMNAMQLISRKFYPKIYYAEKLDYGSFIFKTVPDTFEPSYLWCPGIWGSPQQLSTYTTALELKKLHWYEIYPLFGIGLWRISPESYLSGVDYSPDQTDITFDGQHIFFSKSIDFGYFAISAIWTFDKSGADLYTWHSWQLPNNSKLVFNGQRRDNGITHSYGIIISKDQFGLETVTYVGAP